MFLVVYYNKYFKDFAKIEDIATDEELDMLDLAFGLTDNSRLGCQVRYFCFKHYYSILFFFFKGARWLNNYFDVIVQCKN